jgi:GAF domain-containing protein/anti-sigma regulatory factor (Ser/Thr protein kinase)
MGTLGRTKAGKSRGKSPPPRDGAGGLTRAMAEAKAVEQNKAITDILRVIGSSPADLQPVFDTILSHAKRLCQGNAAVIWQYDGSSLQYAASHGGTDPAAAYFRENPLPLGAYNPTPQAALERRTVHVTDVFSNPKYRPLVPKDSFGTLPNAGTVLAVPLLRQDELFGVISIWRFEKRLFTDKQIAMVETFAAQAAIAIHNVRLHNETKEALEQQTATSEILGVISSSPTDLAPVFDAILKRATQLCDAHLGVLNLYDGERFRSVAQLGANPEFGKYIFERGAFRPVGGSARMLSERRTVQVPDLREGEAYRARKTDAVKFVEVAGARTLLAVPLLKEGRVIGGISIYRPEVRPFTEKQIALVSVFANQAVIAIENVRLFNETKEALERQTATGEVLRVIAGTPADAQPVFDAIAQSALRLFGVSHVGVTLRDGDTIRSKATAGSADPRGEFVIPLNRESTAGRAILDRTVANIGDTEAAEAPSFARESGRIVGFRAIAAAPMLREGEALGSIHMMRKAPGPFSDAQIELLRTFADQAVIAIENARLFNETKEALEQQTATGEILRVISSSPTDIQPVFDSILEHAMRLCDASLGTVGLYDGTNYQHVAQRGGSAEYVEWLFSGPFVPNPEYTLGRMIAERQPFHIADYRELAAYRERNPRSVVTVELGGARTYLAVPMLKEGRVIGGITIRRTEVRPFSQKQIDLVSTFANQAVIAIENVRLFNELQTRNRALTEALEQQTATGDILKVISRSTTDVQPVFETIIRNAVRLCDGTFGMLWQSDGKVMDVGADYNFSPESRAEFRRAFPHPLGTDTPAGQAILEKRVINLSDIHETAYSAAVKERARTLGYRSVLVVPMMRDDEPIGALAVTRGSTGSFADSHVALLETFADQAVIAIENVRLFNETKEALEQQTAISEVLRVISSSPADVQPVLEAVAERAMRICDASDARVLILDGEYLRHAAGRGNLPMQEKVPVHGSVAGRAVVDRRPVQIDDVTAVSESDYPFSIRGFRELGTRMVLAVPLVRENHAQGAIVLRRQEVRPFTAKQIALLKTFADQAAIAIENVRLFNETREALDQQKASAEVLGTISSSIADTRPVFEKILESCTRLFAGHDSSICLVGDDGRIHLAAHHGAHAEELNRLFPLPLSRESGTGSAILERCVMHYPDVFGGADVPPYVRRSAEKTNFRSVVFAPMYWEDEGIGAIVVGRPFAGAFTEKQIALLKSFANQAVIAIQNARLFREIQEKSAQLEVANKHKSDFLANMSHELRTPLNAIIGFSEALMERMFGELNDKQSDYLKDIHDSGKHLLSLINDILDLSKIEAGRMDLEVSSFHLPTALSNAMTLIRERAQRHAIELGLDVDERLGEFQADERKFKQIMLNLLSNAVKFTPDGGRVDVCAKKDTDKIEIAVSDTGIGIAPEDQAAVFEEFKQVGRDQLRKAEGTGLGLALTRRFVELHGGAIRLESTPGKGSTFTVSLPIRN